MKSYRPLFVTSTARSGSYLISMMMSTNRDVTVASEPYLELFRSLRNAFVRSNAPPAVRERFDASAPLQDYYFTDERIALLDAVQVGDLATPFDPAEWESFLTRSVPRAELQCAELAPHLHELRAGTYKEMFDNGLEIIAKVRRSHDRKWVGIKDAWTIEFFGPLARAYPEARFVVILRDPRAVAASMLAVVSTDATQVAHVLSYARHWRKYVAFLEHYRADPLFAERLFFVTHEHVLREPEASARRICEFLEVDYDPAMIDTESYHDWATGGVWQGNSSFETRTAGISVHRAERWRSKLDPTVVRLIELVCGPDMPIVGYEPVTPIELDRLPTADVLEYLIESDAGYANWRSDLGDPQADFGFELFRRALLALPEAAAHSRLVRRSFLFEDVYARLRRGALATVA